MNTAELLWSIGRATIFTSASALAAMTLVALLRVRSPRLHRAAWFLAVLPSWLLVPWTWRVETPPAATPADALRVEVLTTATLSLPTPTVLAPTTTPAARTNQALQLLFVYLGGMIAVVAVGLLRYLRFVRRLPRSEEALDPEWQREWQRQVRPLRIRRPLDLCMSPDLGPLLCFVPCRYLVLVPRPLWSALARAQRIAILRHELAHWRRGDLWWSLAIRALALPQWFNPLAWLAVRRFDEAGEWACDDLVSRGRRSHELAFARSLLAAADFATTTTPGTVAIQGGQLARRVRRLVSHRFKEEAMMKKFLVLIPMAAILLVQLVKIERVIAEDPSPNRAALAALETSPDPAAAVTPDRVEPFDTLEVIVEDLKPKPTYRVQVGDRIKLVGDDGGYGFGRVAHDGGIDNWRIKQAAGLKLEEVAGAFRALHEKAFGDGNLVCTVAEFGDTASGNYFCSQDGKQWIPTLGEVTLGGRTAEEAKAILQAKLADQFESPQITVKLKKRDLSQFPVYAIYEYPDGRNFAVILQCRPTTQVTSLLQRKRLWPEPITPQTVSVAIKRRTPPDWKTDLVIPIDWQHLSQLDDISQEYQLQAGDRLVVTAHGRKSAGLSPSTTEVSATANMVSGATSELAISLHTTPNPYDLPHDAHGHRED